MTLYYTVNNAVGTLTSAHTVSDGILHISPITIFGNNFPLRVTCVRQSDNANFICAIGSSGATTLNITGFLEGTSDLNLSIGDTVQADITAGTIADIHGAIVSISGVSSSGVLAIGSTVSNSVPSGLAFVDNNKTLQQSSSLKFDNTTGNLSASGYLGDGSVLNSQPNLPTSIHRTLGNRFADICNVKDYGAIGDYVTFTSSNNGGIYVIPYPTGLGLGQLSDRFHAFSFSAPFSAQDAGKVINILMDNGQWFNSSIATILNGNQITLTLSPDNMGFSSGVGCTNGYFGFGHDDTVAINAAVNIAGKRKVYFPHSSGSYTLNSTLNFANKSCCIEGDGRGSVIQPLLGSHSGYMLDFTNYTNTPGFANSYPLIHNLNFIGDGLSGVYKQGINLPNVTAATIRNISVRHTGGLPLFLGTSEICKFENINIFKPTNAVSDNIPYVLASGAFNNNVIHNLLLHGDTTPGVASVGVIGALVLVDDGISQAPVNNIILVNTESMTLPSNSCLVSVGGAFNEIKILTADTDKVAGANNTSMIKLPRIQFGAPGNNIITGFLAGSGLSNIYFDTGVFTEQSYNNITCSRAIGSNLVTVASGADYTSLSIIGGGPSADTSILLDNSLISTSNNHNSYFSIPDRIWHFGNGTLLSDNNSLLSIYSNTTSNRPTNPVNGMHIFDTTLNRPLWYHNAWIDPVGGLPINLVVPSGSASNVMNVLDYLGNTLYNIYSNGTLSVHGTWNGDGFIGIDCRDGLRARVANAAVIAQDDNNAVTTKLQSIGGISAGLIGTQSNHNFHFYTNNTSRGFVDANGRWNIQIGTNASRGRVPCVLADHYATINNSGITEVELYSNSLLSNTFAAAGDGVKATYGLNFINSTSTKEIKLYMGGSGFFDTGFLTTTGNGSIYIETLLIRDASSNLRYTVSATITGASPNTICNVGIIPGLDLTGSNNILKITGTSAGSGVSNSDITAILGKIEFKPTLS